MLLLLAGGRLVSGRAPRIMQATDRAPRIVAADSRPPRIVDAG